MEDGNDDDKPARQTHIIIDNNSKNTVESNLVSIHCNASNRKPNSQLSKEEREERRLMKKRIKLQAKISSLHRTIRHAKGRKDFITESSAKKTLSDLLEKENDTIREMQLDSNLEQDQCSSQDICQPTDMKQQAKSVILRVSNALMKRSKSNKERQIVEAVTLLKHMTKGTQQKNMFQETNVLWGYTRQKFYERALLLCTSLARIQVTENDTARSDAVEDEDAVRKEQLIFRQKVWNLFENGLIRKCCSIGCGPGNDLVGLKTFLRLCSKEETDLLEKSVLMDWSIDEWKGAVIDPLIMLLHKQGFNSNDIQMVFCDVTKDLDDKINHDARDIFNQHNQQAFADIDIYLTSYLLSETREKWLPFFKSVVSYAKGGSLFYFAEPVPWQLHRFVDCFQGDLDFMWLDSSMNYPSLQKADRRTGPAVLFAMKRSISQDSITKATKFIH